MIKTLLDKKGIEGVEAFVLLSVYSRFYVVINVLFSFRICMNRDYSKHCSLPLFLLRRMSFMVPVYFG